MYLQVKEADMTLEDIEPVELARQMTLLDYALFQKIRPSEYNNLAWTKRNKETTSPNLLRFIRRFNEVLPTLKGSRANVRKVGTRSHCPPAFFPVLRMGPEEHPLTPERQEARFCGGQLCQDGGDFPETQQFQRNHADRLRHGGCRCASAPEDLREGATQVANQIRRNARAHVFVGLLQILPRGKRLIHLFCSFVLCLRPPLAIGSRNSHPSDHSIYGDVPH